MGICAATAGGHTLQIVNSDLYKPRPSHPLDSAKISIFWQAFLAIHMPGFDENQQFALAQRLKREAARLGFDACGIAEAERLNEEADRLESWLAKGLHASMAYMARNFEKRVDPRKLVPGAKRVISVLCSYWHEADHAEKAGKISRYAWGDDYHQVMKGRLYELYAWLENEVKTLSGRAFVDSAPVMDKVWAQRAGLGWIAKNTNLINPQVWLLVFCWVSDC